MAFKSQSFGYGNTDVTRNVTVVQHIGEPHIGWKCLVLIKLFRVDIINLE